MVEIAPTLTVEIESSFDRVIAHSKHKKTVGARDTITWRNKTEAQATIWFPGAAAVFEGTFTGDVVGVLAPGGSVQVRLLDDAALANQKGPRPYSIACKFGLGGTESAIVMAVGGSSPWVIIR
jgi:hypothetical protein